MCPNWVSNNSMQRTKLPVNATWRRFKTWWWHRKIGIAALKPTLMGQIKMASSKLFLSRELTTRRLRWSKESVNPRNQISESHLHLQRTNYNSNLISWNKVPFSCPIWRKIRSTTRRRAAWNRQRNWTQVSKERSLLGWTPAASRIQTVDEQIRSSNSRLSSLDTKV